MEWLRQNVVAISVALAGFLFTSGGVLYAVRDAETRMIRIEADVDYVRTAITAQEIRLATLERSDSSTSEVLRELRETTARANAYLVALCQATPSARCIYP